MGTDYLVPFNYYRYWHKNSEMYTELTLPYYLKTIGSIINKLCNLNCQPPYWSQTFNTWEMHHYCTTLKSRAKRTHLSQLYVTVWNLFILHFSSEDSLFLSNCVNENFFLICGMEWNLQMEWKIYYKTTFWCTPFYDWYKQVS